jgi:adenylate cyclase
VSNPVSTAYLEATVGGRRRRFPLLPGAICRIGRSPESEIVLPDDAASRSHALLQHADSDELYLTDLGSRNGTFVNARRISAPVVLRPGDIIQIGDQELVFHQERSDAASPASAPVEALATVVRFKMQLITVLVADIRDYTGLSRRLGEARISQVIGVFMQEAGLALQEHGSWAQKYIGDAVMSVWVHRDQLPDLAELRRIFAAVRRLHDIVAGLQPRFGLDAPVRIGVGLNTGLAATGNMGSSALADYTALGDTVNKAFRLESATKEIGCDIALGQATYQALSVANGARPRREPRLVLLKGYDQPEQVYPFQAGELDHFAALPPPLHP